MSSWRGWRGAGTLCVLAMSAAWPATAWANDPATATMLFNDAKRLATSGDYASACPKFEESQRLDPGIGTQFNLADCYEHVGKVASAWALFQDVASASKAAGQGARAQVAGQRAASLEPKLSKLTIVAPKNATGLEVRRNGELLGSVLWGNAIPVDPGSYTIEASAAGKKRWSSVSTVGPNGARVTVTVPPLENADVPEATAARPALPPENAPALATATPPPTDQDAAASGGGSGWQRPTAIVVGAVGLAGIGVGAAFGALSFSKHADYTKHCVGNVCDAAGVAGHQDAVSDGNISTVAFIAGGLATAAGVTLWLTAPKRAPETAVRIVPFAGGNVAGISVSGGWQ